MSSIILNGSGNNRSIIITIDGMTLAVRNQFIDRQSQYLFEEAGLGDHGTPEAPIEWDDLTENEKLDLILQNTLNSQKAQAKVKHTNNRVKNEKDLAEAEANSLFDPIV